MPALGNFLILQLIASAHGIVIFRQYSVALLYYCVCIINLTAFLNLLFLCS